MSKFSDRKSGRTAPAEEGSDDPGVVARISSFKREDAPASSPTPAAPEASPGATDYTHLGEHVGAVLEAAKEAAAKMKHEAVADAERIRGDADERATTLVADARKHAKQIETEASKLEVTAKESSDRIRDEADAYATTKRVDADAEAEAIVERAKQHATDRIRETDAHLQSLGDQVTSTEQRLRQLSDRLRDLATSLDDLVGGPIGATGTENGERPRTGLAETLTESVTEHRIAAQSKELA